MDRDFALKHNIVLKDLPFLALVTIIDGRPISSGDIREESEAVRAKAGELACNIDFNIIHSHEHSVIIGLLLFKLPNQNIDWRN